MVTMRRRSITTHSSLFWLRASASLFWMEVQWFCRYYNEEQQDQAPSNIILQVLVRKKKKKDQINLIKQHIFIAMSWHHLRKWNFYITFNISINNIYLGIASKYFSCSQNESHYLVSKYRTEVHLCSHTGILC